MVGLAVAVGAADGSYGHCCTVYNAARRTFERVCTRDDDTELIRCCGCPRTFHFECIEAGARRHGDVRAGGWLLCALCAPAGWQMLMPREGLRSPPEGMVTYGGALADVVVLE